MNYAVIRPVLHVVVLQDERAQTEPHFNKGYRERSSLKTNVFIELSAQHEILGGNHWTHSQDTIGRNLTFVQHVRSRLSCVEYEAIPI